MERKRLTNIIDSRYIAKIDKYVVNLGIHNEPKRTVWLSGKQMENLETCFEQTKNGYSNKDISIYGFWNNQGYYAYAKIERHKQKRVFKEPYDYDLSDLKDVD